MGIKEQDTIHIFKRLIITSIVKKNACANSYGITKPEEIHLSDAVSVGFKR